MRVRGPLFVVALGALVVASLTIGASVYAQIDGGDRGIAPIDSTSNLEVDGIGVDVRARTGEAARLGGWRLAQRRGWQLLWAKTHGAEEAPGLNDAALDQIVSGIVVEREQIGPDRYVATLGVLFDRSRVGAILGVAGQVQRSAPMLVIPVQWSGGTPLTFEQRTDWQRAWARFRSGTSPVDYVRPSGTGADPLLLNYGQTLRPGRIWWRTLLDQYGASDIVSPQVQLVRSYPGGPVTANFVARRGPDNQMVGTFTLRAASSEGIAQMLDEGVRRIDALYSNALANGELNPDPSLVDPPPVVIDIPANAAAQAVTSGDGGDTNAGTDTDTGVTADAPVIAGPTNSVQIQFETPDVGSVSGIEGLVRGVPGVKSASTTSLALGGTSIMRVVFAGDAATLRLALQARGLRVDDAGGTLRVSRP